MTNVTFEFDYILRQIVGSSENSLSINLLNRNSKLLYSDIRTKIKCLSIYIIKKIRAIFQALV